MLIVIIVKFVKVISVQILKRLTHNVI